VQLSEHSNSIKNNKQKCLTFYCIFSELCLEQLRIIPLDKKSNLKSENAKAFAMMSVDKNVYDPIEIQHMRQIRLLHRERCKHSCISFHSWSATKKTM